MAKKEEQTKSQGSDNLEAELEPRRRSSVALILLVGALIGLGGLLAGGAAGYALGRFQSEARVRSQAAVPERAYLGVGVLNVEGGALIHALQPDDPAEEAGLIVGDIIVEVDGESVGPRSPLESLIFAHEPDDEVEVTVLRGGERETFKVTLGSAPAGFGPQPIPAQPEFVPLPETREFFGPRGPQAPEFFFEPGPYLGVTVVGAQDGGLLVEEVLPGSPAEEAGLIEGDVILSANGEPVDTFEELRAQVAEASVGGQLELGIRRDGEREAVVAEVGGRPRPGIPRDFQPEGASLGVVVQTFTRERADDLDLPYEPGVLVTGVEPDSAAQRVGLRERDIVISIDGEDVREADTLRQMVQEHEPGDVVELEVLREGDLLDFEVALGTRLGVPFFVDPETDAFVVPGLPGEGFPGQIEVYIDPPGCRAGDPLAPCL